MLTETEDKFLRHILGIDTLSRDEFYAVNKSLRAEIDLTYRWRAVSDAVRRLFKEEVISEELRIRCPDWISFAENHFSEIQHLREEHDPLGYARSYLRKVNSEAACQFCSGYSDRKKKLFKSQDEAIRFTSYVTANHGHEKQYPYKCPDGNGWHLTSTGHVLVWHPERRKLRKK